VLTGGDVTVNANLTVGSVAETVNVTEEVSSVQFNTSTMTTTVQGVMLDNLPVLARNPFTLALLNPAVVNQYWDVAIGIRSTCGRTAGWILAAPRAARTNSCWTARP